MSPKSVFDHLGKKPPAGELLDWQLVDYNTEEMWAEVSFAGRETFTNPRGFIHGGILTAMLDEGMGTAVILSTNATKLPTTISLTADYIQPAKCGRIFSRSQVTSLGNSIAFLEGKLTDEEGNLLVRATASYKLFPFDPKFIKNE